MTDQAGHSETPDSAGKGEATPQPSEAIVGQAADAGVSPPHQVGGQVTPSGRRQAFQDVRRQLTEEELSSPGVSKLVLEMLVQAEADRDVAAGYVERYHEADKRAAILDEKLKAQSAIDRASEILLTLGGILVGFSTSLLSLIQQIVLMILGSLMIAASFVIKGGRR